MPETTTIEWDKRYSDGEPPIIKLVGLIIRNAIKQRASHIHLNPLDQKFQILYRIGQTCIEVDSPPKYLQSLVINRIKTMASLDLSVNHLPQQGSILFSLPDSKKYDISVTSVPTVYGEKLVLKISSLGEVPSIDSLGLSEDVKHTLVSLVQGEPGLLVIAGKRQTVAWEFLQTIVKESFKQRPIVMAIQSIWAGAIDGITQIKVRPEEGFSYTQAVRNAIFHNPDMVIIDQLLDSERLELALDVAAAGHWCLTTLNSESSSDVLQELTALGVSPEKLLGTLKGVIYVQQTHTLCNDCKKPSSTMQKPLRERWGAMQFFAAEGCQACAYTGRGKPVQMLELCPMNSSVYSTLYSGNLEDLEAMVVTPVSTQRQHLLRDGVLPVQEFDEVTRLFETVAAPDSPGIIDPTVLPAVKTEEEDEIDLEELRAVPPVVRFVNVILYQAIKDKATEIHFESFLDSFRISYRVNGVNHEMTPPPKHIGPPVINRLKTICGFDARSRNNSERGMIELRIMGKVIDLELLTIPSRFGEQLTLKVRHRGTDTLLITESGLTVKQSNAFKEKLATEKGLYLVCSPYPDLSRSLAAELMDKLSPTASVLWVEEKIVTRKSSTFTQQGLKPIKGLDAGESLASMQVLDLDVAFIDDLPNAKAVNEALLLGGVGTTVVAAVNASNATSLLDRLGNMELDPVLLSRSLKGIIVLQRIKKLCEACSKSVGLSSQGLPETLRTSLDESGIIEAKAPVGCKECAGTGYFGEITVAGITYFSKTDHIAESDKQCDMTAEMLQVAIGGLERGETSLAEIIRLNSQLCPS